MPTAQSLLKYGWLIKILFHDHHHHHHYYLIFKIQWHNNKFVITISYALVKTTSVLLACQITARVLNMPTAYQKYSWYRPVYWQFFQQKSACEVPTWNSASPLSHGRCIQLTLSVYNMQCKHNVRSLAGHRAASISDFLSHQADTSLHCETRHRFQT